MQGRPKEAIDAIEQAILICKTLKEEAEEQKEDQKL